MLDTESVAAALRKHFIERGDGVVAAWLFGSVARGTARRDSDIDVAILFAEAPPSTLAGLPLDREDDLSRQLGRPVQIVVMNEAPVDLVHRVMRDGILVCERDLYARARFEVHARNEYFDLLPYLRRYRSGA